MFEGTVDVNYRHALSTCVVGAKTCTLLTTLRPRVMLRLLISLLRREGCPRACSARQGASGAPGTALPAATMPPPGAHARGTAGRGVTSHGGVGSRLRHRRREHRARAERPLSHSSAAGATRLRCAAAAARRLEWPRLTGTTGSLEPRFEK